MSYFINKRNQKIAYKRIRGKSPGIVFIHGLNSDMEGKKAIFVEKYAKLTNAIIAINCNSTLICINLLEYFLLVSPPLNKVPIPSRRTIPTAINKVMDNIFTNIPEIINVL